MYIKSTHFPHKRIHLGTWKSPDGRTTNQIDHVVIRKRFSSSIIDIRSCRGPNCDSDHYLVKAVLREKIIDCRKNNIQPRKWNLENLKNERYKEIYRNRIHEEIRSRGERESVEENWKVIKESVNEVAKEILGQVNRAGRTEWFDDDCRVAIERKNAAHIRI